jgi:HAD superfamily hydrolase (TIGR01484 family)
MRALSHFQNAKVKVLFSDIDGTITTKGQVTDSAFEAIWKLSRAGIAVVPVTGRPAGWCELIARQWPVHGVIGENGAFYFRVDEKMKRVYFSSKANRKQYRERFKKILARIGKEVPRARLASDQFCRQFDLAIDFAEDVSPPLSKKEIATVVKLFNEAGAQAKVSDIHVNGWFGDYNKRTACEQYVRDEFGFSPDAMQSRCVFVGDSPNDEPMFELFQNSFAVANFADFADEVEQKPAFISDQAEGAGFAQIAELIIGLKSY